jgi:hopanoid biosynthesis associated protein HpnK
VSHSGVDQDTVRFTDTPHADSITESIRPSPSMRSKRLVVNADDFGRSDSVNLGVAQAFRQGIVTSASIVAAGPAFESAVALAAGLSGLAVGVHLVVNEYTPVLPPAEIPRLVNSKGRFFSRGRQFLRMAFDPRIRGDLLREWDAQISKVLRAGIKVSHIDGHGHCHAHPAAAGIVLQLADRYGITHVRVPAEPILWKSGEIRVGRFLEKTMLWGAVQVTLLSWRGRLQFPSSFYGFSHGGRMTESVVRRAAETVPAGVSELMVHVGVSNDEAPGFWTGYDYAGDLRAVTTYCKQEFEQEFGVSLVTHISGGH